MSVLNVISGPVIGSVIGYFTNYIAVKMLFRPYYPVKIGKHTLPFTPGIIPRRKGAMAKAVGKAVGENLLTQQDLEDVLLSEEVQKSVTEEICGVLYFPGNNELPVIRDLLQSHIGDEQYVKVKENLEGIICDKIIYEISGLGIGALIAKRGSEILREKTKGTLLEMMVSDELIVSISQPVGEYIEEYISENGHEIIKPMLDRQADGLEGKTLAELLETFHVEEDQVREMVGRVYKEVVEKKAKDVVAYIQIADIVEEKINEMDVKEIETLVLSVMEHELNAIINLGALIGFLIGIINIFI